MLLLICNSTAAAFSTSQLSLRFRGHVVPGSVCGDRNSSPEHRCDVCKLMKRRLLTFVLALFHHYVPDCCSARIRASCDAAIISDFYARSAVMSRIDNLRFSLLKRSADRRSVLSSLRRGLCPRFAIAAGLAAALDLLQGGGAPCPTGGQVRASACASAVSPGVKLTALPVATLVGVGFTRRCAPRRRLKRSSVAPASVASRSRCGRSPATHRPASR